MLSEDILKKLNFIALMVSNYNTLVLPRDWWYTSIKREDGYIDMVDVVASNRLEIENFFAEHNISVKLNPRDRTYTYKLKY